METVRYHMLVVQVLVSQTIPFLSYLSWPQFCEGWKLKVARYSFDRFVKQEDHTMRYCN